MTTSTVPRVLGFVLLSASMSASQAAGDVETLRRAIEQTANAINANDPDGIMAHYSKDVVVSYPGIPDTTYDEFARSYRQMLSPDLITRTAPTIDEILVSGDLATIRMRWSTTITDKATGRSSSRQAKDLQIWRRENGTWKFFRGMWHHIRSDAPRLTLVAISVPKLEDAIAWYQQNLEMTVRDNLSFPEQHLKVALLERDGVRVELVELTGSSSPAALKPALDNPAQIQGFGKVAFTVADIDAWAATLKTKGVRFQLEPRTNPRDNSRSFIVLDNNGNWVQFTTPR